MGITIAISNQKGGVGKSTVTAVLASYFNYVRGLKVAVVDCDYPQFSLEKLRGRDLKNLEKSEYHQRLFCRQFEDGSRKAYPIVTSTPESAAEIPGKLEGDYDLIFFDLLLFFHVFIMDLFVFWNFVHEMYLYR